MALIASYVSNKSKQCILTNFISFLLLYITPVLTYLLYCVLFYFFWIFGKKHRCKDFGLRLLRCLIPIDKICCGLWQGRAACRWMVLIHRSRWHRVTWRKMRCRRLTLVLINWCCPVIVRWSCCWKDWSWRVGMVLRKDFIWRELGWVVGWLVIDGFEGCICVCVCVCV